MNISQISDICTGCGSCVAVCPSAAIRMQPDEHGFLHPAVEAAACTDCGLCARKCPVSTPPQVSAHTEILTGYANDEALLPASSSGAIFPVLASEIIRRGGIVFGAAFDQNFDVAHTAAESAAELAALCSSKYVQSSIPSGIYAQVKAALTAGRWVYFSGMPCQVAGLKNYLGREYETLITQDTACHSVPSPMVWKNYRSALEMQNGSKLKSFSFRKKATGWENYHIHAAFENGREFYSSLPRIRISVDLSKVCIPAAPALIVNSRASSGAAISHWRTTGASRVFSRKPTIRRGHPLFCCTARKAALCWNAARIGCKPVLPQRARLHGILLCSGLFRNRRGTMSSGQDMNRNRLRNWFPPAANRQRKRQRRNAGTEAFWPASFAA